MRIPRALTIAGSDSGGGAGIQADLKTFSAFRVFGMSVITAVTAQNSIGVQGVESLPPAFVAQQLDSVLDDFGADAVKCGMLATAPIIEALAEALRERPVANLVVDPVMVAKSGDPLLPPDARRALVEHILPLALVVTPNLPEAGALTGFPVTDRESMEAAARRIGELGPSHVLVKGGHLKGDPHRSPVGRARVPGVPRRADRLAQHPWHRLHAVGGHRGGAGPRALLDRFHHAREGLRHARHPRRLPGRTRRRPAPALPGGVVTTDEGKMSFLEHLGELRTRIVWSLIPTAVGLIVAFRFSDRILQFVRRPLDRANVQLVALTPTEGFWTSMKISMVMGVILAMPVILWQVWAFIAPGLHKHERRFAGPFVIVGSVLFLLGAAFALLVVMPFGVEFLLNFTKDQGIQPMISVSSHVDLVIKFTLGFGLVFELPLVLTMLSRMGIVTPQFLSKNRKYAILVNFVIAAILTPTPDILNQSLMAGPLIVLYEVGILAARVFGKRSPKAVPPDEPVASEPPPPTEVAP